MVAPPKFAAQSALAALLLYPLAAGAAPAAGGKANSPAQVAAWRAVGELPDWSGVWLPDIGDQTRQEKGNLAPWTPAAQAQIDFQWKETYAGRPPLVLYGCFPHGMPTWMMINHNAMEILFTPGRVTMLGEVDGNRMRRIYTDGRGHPEDPDPTYHGHSIGKWEGDTLVIDTVGIAPQASIGISESVGLPNNGDIHIVERIKLRSPDVLEDAMTITAPKVFTRPWQTTRLWRRVPSNPMNDIVEGQCISGDYMEGKDANGNDVFVPATTQRVLGGVVPLKE